MLCVGDLPEQINPSTLVSQMKRLQITSKDTERFTAVGSQSGQQYTPVTVWDFDAYDQVVIYKKIC